MEETPQVEAQENVQGLEVIKVDFSDFKNVEIVDSGDFKFIQLDADGDYFRGVFAGLPNSAKIDGFNFVLLEDFTNGKTGEIVQAGTLVTAPNYHAFSTHVKGALENDEDLSNYAYHVERLEMKALDKGRSVLRLKILRAKKA